jgi:hypothetical protein
VLQAAPLLIAAVSTFSLWPALANTQGRVHLPVCPLFLQQCAPPIDGVTWHEVAMVTGSQISQSRMGLASRTSAERVIRIMQLPAAETAGDGALLKRFRRRDPCPSLEKYNPKFQELFD